LFVADKETATADTQDQPIWVQDLLAWLKKIEGLNLTGDEWVARVQEVLAELPGQELPEELWQKNKTSAIWAESVQEEVQVESLLISHEDRAELQQRIEVAQATHVPHVLNEHFRSDAIAAVFTQIPTAETQLLQQALDIAQQSIDGRQKVIAAVATRLPTSERQSLLKGALEIVRAVQQEEYRSSALAVVATRLPPSEPRLLQQALETAGDIKSDDWNHSKALVSIAAQIPSTKPQLLEQFLKAACAKDRKFDDSKWRYRGNSLPDAI
jgi:hypothetical protein